MFVRFLLHRPIAVFMSFLIAVSLGFYLFDKIPVSLLPNIDVPQIVVKINYPNTGSSVMEENVTRLIRENLITLDGLVDIESQSTNQTSSVNLVFDYRTQMDLAFIAVNEKLDRIISVLPKDLPRPQVMRINTTDIPIIHLQIIPKLKGQYIQISELTEKVIKKRIEQIDGVSIVDINGKRSTIITVKPKFEALRAVGLSMADIEDAIKAANLDLGSLSVQDGQYRYFIKLSSHVQTVDQLKEIPLKLKGGIVSTIEKFCVLEEEAEEAQGYHIYNGSECLVVTVQKQANSRMNDLVPKIDSAVSIFKKDYPQVDFKLNRDQSFLLDQGIQNLTQDLIYGGILCVALLFLFLGNYASPILMSVSIPVSLLLTFIFFYLFKISFNIISLSGLALGIGMLIDNSIVVLDSITRRRREGLSMEESCVIGVRDVMSPVISNVLTTVAIYAPLIYMSGLAGALVYDQAIALTISLTVSLLVAFCLNPVMYKYLLKTDPEKLKEDTKIYTSVSKGYHRMIYHIFRHKGAYFGFTLALIPLGFIFFLFVPVTTLPAITETETLVKIDWNGAVDANENFLRVQRLGSILKNHVVEWEADAGVKQFLLQETNNSAQNATVYYKCADENTKKRVDQTVQQWFKINYPTASKEIIGAPNAFTQLFENNKPYFEVRLKPFENIPEDELDKRLENVLAHFKPHFIRGSSFTKNVDVEIILDNEKLVTYGITIQKVHQELQRLFGAYKIAEMKRFGNTKLIQLQSQRESIDLKLNTSIVSDKGTAYPLHNFLKYSYGYDPKYIQADKSGLYHSVSYKQDRTTNFKELEQQFTKTAADNGLSASFIGSYYSDKNLLKEMLVIFIISLLLLYFVLAIQFNNLVHPFLVMFTIPLGIGGSMFTLWLAGGTLNVMSAVGFIVVLGIIVDDPSLKVETINRLRAAYVNAGMNGKREILLKALHDAGEICLKPLLMVSLTTSLALVPVFFTGGIGNDLQKPLVYIIVGGLTIGTFFTLWFIPLAYWFITKKGN